MEATITIINKSCRPIYRNDPSASDDCGGPSTRHDRQQTSYYGPIDCRACSQSGNNNSSTHNGYVPTPGVPAAAGVRTNSCATMSEYTEESGEPSSDHSKPVTCARNDTRGNGRVHVEIVYEEKQEQPERIPKKNMYTRVEEFVTGTTPTQSAPATASTIVTAVALVLI